MSRMEELKAALDKQRDDWSQFDDRCLALAREVVSVLITRLDLKEEDYRFRPLERAEEDKAYSLRGAMEYDQKLCAMTFGFVFKVPDHANYLMRFYVQAGVQRKVIGSLDYQDDEGHPIQGVVKGNLELELFADMVISRMVERFRLQYERTIEGLKV